MRDRTADRNWQFACSTCGTPFESEPEFCYDCGESTVVPIDRIRFDR
jgi:rRNA maturation endonuclease Nob1